MKISKKAAKWTICGGMALAVGVPMAGMTYEAFGYDSLRENSAEARRLNEILDEKYELSERTIPEACPLTKSELIPSACADAAILYGSLQRERNEIVFGEAYQNFRRELDDLRTITSYSLLGAVGFLFITGMGTFAYLKREEEEEEEKKASKTNLSGDDSLKRIEESGLQAKVSESVIIAAEEEYQASLEDFDQRFRSRYGN